MRYGAAAPRATRRVGLRSLGQLPLCGRYPPIMGASPEDSASGGRFARHSGSQVLRDTSFSVSSDGRIDVVVSTPEFMQCILPLCQSRSDTRVPKRLDTIGWVIIGAIVILALVSLISFDSDTASEKPDDPVDSPRLR
jgi:hypothetical protein